VVEVYFVNLYTYRCTSCRRWMYVVNSALQRGGRDGHRARRRSCPYCGGLMNYKGKVRVVVPREDYEDLLSKKVLEEAPIPLPWNMGGEFRSWAAVYKALRAGRGAGR